MSAELVDHRRLDFLHLTVQSAATSLASGLRHARRGELDVARRWYARSDASLAFAGALGQFLASRRCRIIRP